MAPHLQRPGTTDVLCLHKRGRTQKPTRVDVVRAVVLIFIHCEAGVSDYLMAAVAAASRGLLFCRTRVYFQWNGLLWRPLLVAWKHNVWQLQLFSLFSNLCLDIKNKTILSRFYVTLGCVFAPSFACTLTVN